MTKFTVSGKLVSGALRGKPLIDRFYYQIVSTLGYEPVPGTMDIRINRPIDIGRFATHALDRILLDGSTQVDLYLAPVTLIIWKKHDYIEIEEKPQDGKTLNERLESVKNQQQKIIIRERQLQDMIGESVERHDAWAVQEGKPIDRSVIEILDKVNIREKFNLEDGASIDVIFTEKPVKKGITHKIDDKIEKLGKDMIDKARELRDKRKE